MSTLNEPDEAEEGLLNPSARIAEDPTGQTFVKTEQDFVEDYDEEDEQGEDNLGPVPPDVYYSTQDMQELHEEWQETH